MWGLSGAWQMAHKGTAGLMFGVPAELLTQFPHSSTMTHLISNATPQRLQLSYMFHLSIRVPPAALLQITAHYATGSSEQTVRLVMEEVHRVLFLSTPWHVILWHCCRFFTSASICYFHSIYLNHAFLLLIPLLCVFVFQLGLFFFSFIVAINLFNSLSPYKTIYKAWFESVVWWAMLAMLLIQNKGHQSVWANLISRINVGQVCFCNTADESNRMLIWVKFSIHLLSECCGLGTKTTLLGLGKHHGLA